VPIAISTVEVGRCVKHAYLRGMMVGLEPLASDVCRLSALQSSAFARGLRHQRRKSLFWFRTPPDGGGYFHRLSSTGSMFEQMASYKYDQGVVEADKTVCIRPMDLPVASAN
jgi:hypothetical protein